ncbi:MAG: AFG1 family ATPase [Rhodospirillales bacterium]|nr:AFG1 family ATPase [Rhodospirillales bacterium]
MDARPPPEPARPSDAQRAANPVVLPTPLDRIDLSGGPLPAYRAELASGALAADPAQAAAAERLQSLWTALRGYEPRNGNGNGRGLLARLRRRLSDASAPGGPNGLYLVGEVGRGKSMLMDLFFASAQVARKRRIHFHAFMQESHGRIFGMRQEMARLGRQLDDPIPPLADAVAAEAALLCFDEFQVNDIADALILGRLFEALFDRGVVVVATSNTPPDALFAGQPGRDAFLPFIAILKTHLDVLDLGHGRDFRRARALAGGVWFVPADTRAQAALDQAFAGLAGGAPPRPVTLSVMGRTLTVPLATDDVARFDFRALCAAALGPGDYLALATHFQALVLDAIPLLSPDSHDVARRFITLIDALYDHRVKLVASAAAEPDALYPRGEGAAAFRRTASRLEEMRSQDYLELPHLS